MGTRNLIAAIGLIALAAWYGAMAAELPERAIPNTPGPSFFPWIICAALMALSVALLVQGARTARRSDVVADTGPALVMAAAGLASFLAYLAILPVLGFFVASVPFFAALMVLYGERRLVWVASGGLGLPAAVFVLFRQVFQIPLPRGVLSILGG